MRVSILNIDLNSLIIVKIAYVYLERYFSISKFTPILNRQLPTFPKNCTFAKTLH